ncbi:MAG: sensor histidine kinase [Bacteroidetes bacterium]|nr:sensor histidine kinase [Bacteroidota bacterium]
MVALVRRWEPLQAIASGQDAGNLHYPATDWVLWAEDESGVYAAEVLPPARSNPRLSDYVQPGDRLLAVNFLRVANAEVVYTLSRGAPPGTVLLYRLERMPVSGQSPEQFSLFVRTTYKPVLLFTGSALLWGGHLIMMILLGGVALALLFLVAPFVRTGDRQVWPVAILLAGIFLLALNQALRHLLLAIDLDFSLLGYERAAFSLLAVLLLLIPLLSLYALVRTSWILLPGVLGALLGLAGLVIWVWGDHFAVYELWYVQYLIGVLLAQLLGLQVWVAGQPQAPRRRRWSVLLLVVLGILLGLHLADAWEILLLSPPQRNYLYVLAILALALPMVYSTRAAVQFGNLNLVRNRSLGLSLGLMAVLLAYLLLDRLLESLLGDALNRGLIEIGVIFLLALLLRTLYVRYQDSLNRFLPLGPGRREQRMQQFLYTIPRYTSSEKLLADVSAHAREYLGATFCEIYTFTHSSAPLLEGWQDRLQQLQQQLPPNQFWSSAQQLREAELPADMDAWLQAQGISLAYALGLTSERYGLLLIGPKKAGVYNLGETELLRRLAQQTRLSLELLYLLEREKELVQQNLEANLAALRSQINPHFLFNTLNTIADLIHHMPDLAEQAVEKLAYIFRYTLRVSGQDFVPLGEEIALVRNYLDIEQIRFGDRLSISIDVSTDAAEVPIPAFVLQTLVENCIKHGIAKLLAQGKVEISARVQDGWLVCTVYDNGPGIDPARVQKGTGLRNILARTRSLYNLEDLLAFSNTGNGTLVTLKLPLTHEYPESTGG